MWKRPDVVSRSSKLDGYSRAKKEVNKPTCLFQDLVYHHQHHVARSSKLTGCRFNKHHFNLGDHAILYTHQRHRCRCTTAIGFSILSLRAQHIEGVICGIWQYIYHTPFQAWDLETWHNKRRAGFRRCMLDRDDISTVRPLTNTCFQRLPGRPWDVRKVEVFPPLKMGWPYRLTRSCDEQPWQLSGFCSKHGREMRGHRCSPPVRLLRTLHCRGSVSFPAAATCWLSETFSNAAKET